MDFRLLPLALKGSGAVGFLVLIVAAAGVWGIHGALLFVVGLPEGVSPVLFAAGFLLSPLFWGREGVGGFCLTLMCTMIWLAGCSSVHRQQKDQLQASGAFRMCSFPLLVHPCSTLKAGLPSIGAVSRHPCCVHCRQLQAGISSGWTCCSIPRGS